MASKVLVPGVPFASLQIKKSPSEPNGSGFYIADGDSTGRIAHLEHSVRFLQEQHRQMLSGLHAEIESLRERNRDLQFQLIFNKEPSKSAVGSEDIENQMSALRREVERLEHEATVARGEATAHERKAFQLQDIVDAQAIKIRELERASSGAWAETRAGEAGATGVAGVAGAEESRAELRARLTEAERLVRRLRGDAERQRREVLGGAGVTNLLFDGAAARHAHLLLIMSVKQLQCMKNALLRANGVDAFGFQNFHFPHMHTSDFWREPLREEYSMGSRGRHHRRPVVLPELTPSIQRSTVYANHARIKGNPERVKKSKTHNGEAKTEKNDEESTDARVKGNPDRVKKSKTVNGELKSEKNAEESTDARGRGKSERVKKSKTINGEPKAEKNAEESIDHLRLNPFNTDNLLKCNDKHVATYPELKIVVTKIIPHGNVHASTTGDGTPRTRRPHRKNGNEQT